MALSNEAIVPLSLDRQQAERLDSAAEGLSKEQLIWSSGYLAGLASASGGVVQPAAVDGAAAAETTETLTILYGSQTGNGRALAETLYAQASARGVNAALVDMAEFTIRDIAKERWLAVIVSTHGEGDAPDDAELLLEYINSKRAPNLNALGFFVLALGDSSYAQFCQTGREFDERLAALGGTRLSDRVDCDVDYDAPAAAWFESTLDIAVDKMGSASADNAVARVPLQVVDNRPQYSKTRPFEAEVLANQRITGSGSTKTVHHIELSLEGSGLDYEPGDAVGVITPNPAELVAEVVDLLGIDGDFVSIGGESVTIEDALTHRLELTLNSGAFLTQYAALTGYDELATALDDAGQRQALLDDYQVIDVLRKWPFNAVSEARSIQSFVETLRPLTPRVYSISSSLESNPDEVHLTVAHVAYDAFGVAHSGVASTALIESFEEGDRVPLFIDKNPRFRLPESRDTDIIMIGPGTGVAPFRAFVQRRAESTGKGRNWLFFGDRQFDEDFLYQTEWQQHLKRHALDRLDVAFSRDQSNKVYVQDRLLENRAEIYAWLTSGASIYVCGDATSMAPDVHAALVSIVASEGGHSEEAANAYLKNMKRERRYLRDVY